MDGNNYYYTYELWPSGIYTSGDRPVKYTGFDTGWHIYRMSSNEATGMTNFYMDDQYVTSIPSGGDSEELAYFAYRGAVDIDIAYVKVTEGGYGNVTYEKSFKDLDGWTKTGTGTAQVINNSYVKLYNNTSSFGILSIPHEDLEIPENTGFVVEFKARVNTLSGSNATLNTRMDGNNYYYTYEFWPSGIYTSGDRPVNQTALDTGWHVYRMCSNETTGKTDFYMDDVYLKSLQSGGVSEDLAYFAYRGAVDIDIKYIKVYENPPPEVLYNGIVLPSVWPPDNGRNILETMTVPYIDNPPDVIPIDVGRQLFVDDFLIEETTLSRSFHQADYYPSNPILIPDKSWEMTGSINSTYPFSGGVWYDPDDEIFKMWYGVTTDPPIKAKWTSYAVSEDGINWQKPVLSVQNRPASLDGTNVVMWDIVKDGECIWLDFNEKDLNKRFKYFTKLDENMVVRYRTSPDGINWGASLASRNLKGDRSTVFYNPFRDVWVLSERQQYNDKRARAYLEDRDVIKLLTKANDSVDWVASDPLDPHNPITNYADIVPELYNLDAISYESVMLGQFCIWTGDPRYVENADPIGAAGGQKRVDILLGFSRDGFHWDRTSRERFISANWVDDAWNQGNVQSVIGSPLIVGDKLYFYVSGRAKDPTKRAGNVTVGLATLRRDGFASMDAGTQEGVLTTRPITFSGSRLFVNADCADGQLRAEILDSNNQVIAPFTKQNCTPVQVDETIASVGWQGIGDLSVIQGQNVKIRFYLTNGSLYSFWVSPDESGASYGYISSGPGFSGGRDTVGLAAYEAAEEINN
jgi:hypothetical protein